MLKTLFIALAYCGQHLKTIFMCEEFVSIGLISISLGIKLKKKLSQNPYQNYLSLELDRLFRHF